MKTTKDLAEMMFAELDRVSRGEVRKEVIAATTKLMDGLVKLARLEMDHSFRIYGDRQPDVPWLASRNAEAEASAAPPPRALPAPAGLPEARTARGQDIEKQIAVTLEKLAAKDCTATMRKILTDRLETQKAQLARAEAAGAEK